MPMSTDAGYLIAKLEQQLDPTIDDLKRQLEQRDKQLAKALEALRMIQVQAEKIKTNPDKDPFWPAVVIDFTVYWVLVEYER